MTHIAQVGDVEVLSLLDVGDWTLAGFFPLVSPEEWARYRALYPDALGETGSILTSATAYAVRSSDSVILVDTGLGPGPHERIGGQTGQLLAELRSAGIGPADVDLVVFTHLHRDHVGWNALGFGTEAQPTFSRARYLAPRKDWEYYRQPTRAERAAHLAGTVALFEQGLVDLVDGERAVGRNITLLPTPGHTPGHQAVLVASGGERAAIIGDLAHTPPQVEEIDWSATADTDPKMASAMRGQVFDRIEADHTLLCAGHFPHPGFGYLTRVEGRRIFQAIKP